MPPGPGRRVGMQKMPTVEQILQRAIDDKLTHELIVGTRWYSTLHFDEPAAVLHLHLHSCSDRGSRILLLLRRFAAKSQVGIHIQPMSPDVQLPGASYTYERIRRHRETGQLESDGKVHVFKPLHKKRKSKRE